MIKNVQSSGQRAKNCSCPHSCDVRRAARGGVLGAVLVLFVAAGVAAVAAAFVLMRQIEAPGPLREDRVVRLEAGRSARALAATLEAEGVVRHAWLFLAAARIEGEAAALKAGEYRFPAGVSALDAVEIVAAGKSILYTVTLPEGRTVADALAILAAHPALAGETPAAPPEGGLLPETYAFTRGTRRADIVARMAEAHAAFLDEAWPWRAADLPLATPREAVILASIVEKETGLAAERGRVAAVFVNRLRRGMRLESDPTVIYGLAGGAPLGRGLRVSELNDAANPYNTYEHAGLPPGPIANPGKAAILAVLNPPQTDDLFFVADGTGGHAFAATLDEHNRNVARWRALERARARGEP